LPASTDHFLGSFRAAHDFEQAHDVGGAEEMMADHHLRTSGGRGDFVDAERGRVGSEDAIGLGDLIERAENFLLQRHAFEHGFDDDIGLIETIVGELRRDQRHALIHHGLREAALFHRIFVILFDDGHAAIERVLRGFLDDDRDAGIGVVHRNTAAHGTRADDGGLLDVVGFGVLGNVRDFGHGAFAEEGVDQRFRLY
jgi:hypothetical protein